MVCIGHYPLFRCANGESYCAWISPIIINLVLVDSAPCILHFNKPHAVIIFQSDRIAVTVWGFGRSLNGRHPKAAVYIHKGISAQRSVGVCHPHLSFTLIVDAYTLTLDTEVINTAVLDVIGPGIEQMISLVSLFSEVVHIFRVSVAIVEP